MSCYFCPSVIFFILFRLELVIHFQLLDYGDMVGFPFNIVPNYFMASILEFLVLRFPLRKPCALSEGSPIERSNWEGNTVFVPYWIRTSSFAHSYEWARIFWGSQLSGWVYSNQESSLTFSRTTSHTDTLTVQQEVKTKGPSCTTAIYVT